MFVNLRKKLWNDSIRKKKERKNEIRTNSEKRVEQTNNMPMDVISDRVQLYSYKCRCIFECWTLQEYMNWADKIFIGWNDWGKMVVVAVEHKNSVNENSNNDCIA